MLGASTCPDSLHPASMCLQLYAQARQSVVERGLPQEALAADDSPRASAFSLDARARTWVLSDRL